MAYVSPTDAACGTFVSWDTDADLAICTAGEVEGTAGDPWASLIADDAVGWVAGCLPSAATAADDQGADCVCYTCEEGTAAVYTGIDVAGGSGGATCADADMVADLDGATAVATIAPGAEGAAGECTL